MLGFALSRLCFEGPEEELKRTANTQPAILTHSIAALAGPSGALSRAARGSGLRRGALARRVLGGASRPALSPSPTPCGWSASAARFMQEAVPAGRGRDGGDRRAAARRRRGRLPRSRAGRGRLAGQLQLSRADRHRRPRGGRRARLARRAWRGAPNARSRFPSPRPSTARSWRPRASGCGRSWKRPAFADAAIPVVTNVDARSESAGRASARRAPSPDRLPGALGRVRAAPRAGGRGSGARDRAGQRARRARAADREGDQGRDHG